MEDKATKFLLIFLFCLIDSYIFYVCKNNEGVAMEINYSQDDREDKAIEKEFISLYNQWRKYMQQPEIIISSRSEDYINCEPYRDIIALGKDALPYIINKIKQDRDFSWDKGDFFLWHAVKEITKIDFSGKDKFLSEQEIANRYIDWWEKNRDKFNKEN